MDIAIFKILEEEITVKIELSPRCILLCKLSSVEVKFEGLTLKRERRKE